MLKLRTAIGAAIITVISQAAFAQLIIDKPGTYQSYGQQTYTPDGTTYSTYGHQTYGSDGSTYSTYGHQTYGSDGTTYNTYGNTTYGSDGSTARTYGNQTYINRPDGQTRTCQTIGSQTFCN